MRIEEFLHNLHHDVNNVKPHDWVVDWEDAPLPYKIYRGLPSVPLASDVEPTLEGGKPSAVPGLREIGHFLWSVFGLSQVIADLFSMRNRRFVPSGGGLYPSELYAYLKLDELPVGLYHYDVAHHRLVLVREGEFDAYLARALGDRCDVSACFGTVFVSTMFWKNFFKYHNFAYRLQGLDAGVLIGQVLEVSKRYGFETGVYFQFLDRAINHLLGLSEQEESVYAVIPLSVEPSVTWQGGDTHGAGSTITATELCRELTPLRHEHYVRSKRIREYPVLLQMNEASLLESTQSFQHFKGKKAEDFAGQALALPPVNRLTYDLASASRKRYSPGNDFVMGKVDATQLAAFLQEATASFAYRNDLDGAQEEPESRVSVHGCLYGIEDVPNGAYRYESKTHTLQQIRSGDHRMRLQQGNTLQNVNLFQVPLCLHVSGDRDHLITELGYRGHRIQQMEAGMLVQRLLLSANALGMGGHPLLDYDVGECDDLYHLAPSGKTSLIQLPVGPYRPRSLYEGGLHS